MIRQQIVKLIHWSVMQRFLMVEKTLADFQKNRIFSVSVLLTYMN